MAIGLVVVLGGGAFALSRGSSQKSAAPLVQRVFSAYVDVGKPQALAPLGKFLGYPITFGTDCFDDRTWSGIDDDLWLIQRWKGAGYPMTWCVPMLPLGHVATLAEGATGAYNSHFVQLANLLIANGLGNSSLRIGWEFNSPTYPWYAAGQASAFIAYWRQIVTAMRSVPGAHFTFVWNVARSNPGPAAIAMGNLDAYYPGGAYVDKVGIDVYDQASLRYPGAQLQFQDILTGPGGLDWIARFGASHRRAVIVPEFGLGSGPSGPNSGPIVGPGLVSGGDDPTFVDKLFAWARTNHVYNLAYWDYGSSSIDNGQNPFTASALRAQLARY